MVTSVDGILAATADSTGGGVLLRADYSSTWGVTDTFESNVTGWTNNFGATVARTTTAPITGTGSLLWTRQSADSSLIRALPTFTSKPYDQKVVVYFKAKTTLATGRGVVLSLNWFANGHTEIGIANSVYQQFFGVFYVDANTIPNSQMIFSAGPNNDSDTLESGNLVIDDVVVEIQPPVGVNMFRNDKPVRGASPAPTADGIAYGYDYEASNGIAATWTAQPVYSISDTEIVGPVGAGATFTPPDITGAASMWLKSTTNPNLSRKVIGKWPAPDRTWEGRDSLAANPGAGLMSGSWDVPVRQAETWVLETTTPSEHKAMEMLLRSGPLLLQWSSKFGTDDLHALPKSVGWNYKRGPLFPERLWTVSFQPIAAPPSTSAPLVIPNRSYGDLFGAYGIYSAVAANIASYNAYLAITDTTPPVVVPPSATGYGTTNYGTTSYGS